jgi:hypothetical protein
MLTAAALGLGLAAGAAIFGLAAAGPDEDLARIGELNAMGLPVVETPGTGDGRSEAAGVVVEAARWDLGQVPLNVAVRPTWTLRNTGDRPVILGEPHPELREGCCPGPTTLGTRTLAPGASTTLTFELAMHPGMDGPHDLGLHIPVDDGTTSDEVLTVEVVGDFRS